MLKQISERSEEKKQNRAHTIWIVFLFLLLCKTIPHSLTDVGGSGGVGSGLECSSMQPLNISF